MLSTPKRLGSALPVLIFLAGLFLLPFAAMAEEVLVAHPALTFGDIPYFIAREKGFYREEGLDVKDLYIRGGVTASQALQAGSVQFTLALGTGARAALSGMTIKAIMVVISLTTFCTAVPIWGCAALEI
jgi:NitT/TauT family transport system substrate-binding protein